MTDPEKTEKDIYSEQNSSAPQTGPVATVAAVPDGKHCTVENQADTARMFSKSVF